MAKPPVYFGHLMPEDEHALDDIMAELRRQFAALGPGQFFTAKFGKDPRGRITSKTVAITPPQVFPVRVNGS